MNPSDKTYDIPPLPLFQLPPDSDLRETEKLYEASDLADVEFVYEEMLNMRFIVQRMQRLQERDQDAAWTALQAIRHRRGTMHDRVVLAMLDAQSLGLVGQAAAAVAVVRGSNYDRVAATDSGRSAA